VRIDLLLGKLPVALGGLGRQPVRPIKSGRDALLQRYPTRLRNIPVSASASKRVSSFLVHRLKRETGVDAAS
jgi:hypothetical protein